MFTITIRSFIYYNYQYHIKMKLPKGIVSTICDLPLDSRHRILKVALAIIQPKIQDLSKAIEKISNECHISREKTNELLSIYIAITRLFLETSDKEFNSKLAEIGFTPDFIENLPLVSNRVEVVETISNLKKCDYGKLSSLKWRADISLVNSSLQKKVPISVILSVTLSNGKKYVIEIDGKTFHKLRYNVALLFKEFNTVKSSFATNK